MVNQALERILGCFFDGEGPSRGFRKFIFLSSSADRLKRFEDADARRWVVLEPPTGEVDVEELFAFSF